MVCHIEALNVPKSRLVNASLLFCVGSMAIVGSLQSGLEGNHETLFTKSVLDGITSIIFTSTMGIGVILSAVSVFIYQGAVTLLASSIKVLLTDAIVAEMTAVGSLLILVVGLKRVGATKINVANILPAVLIPFIYGMIMKNLKNGRTIKKNANLLEQE